MKPRLDSNDDIRYSAMMSIEPNDEPVTVEQARARAIARYHDPTWPERQCDYCQRPYRGPAVYCSLICALADA